MKLLSLVPALALVVSGSATAPAAEARRVTLRGSTTVDSSSSGWAPVRLPKDVDPFAAMQDSDNPHSPFVFSGDGRIIAFVLTMEAGEHPLGEGPTLIGWSFGRCEEKGCAAKGFLINNVVATGPLKRKDGREVLPAGDYRLYFVQDGARASIRFEFDGLSGTTRLGLPNRLTKRVKTLVPRSDLGAQESVYWGGRATKIAGAGASILGLWVEGEAAQDTAGEAGFCIYGDPPPDPDTAYVPPCPAADDASTQQMRSENNEFSYFNYKQLDRGLGAHYTTPIPVSRAGGVALWLKY